MSAELSLVLSQFMRVTDGQTDKRADAQLCDGKDRVHTMQRGNQPY